MDLQEAFKVNEVEKELKLKAQRAYWKMFGAALLHLVVGVCCFMGTMFYIDHHEMLSKKVGYALIATNAVIGLITMLSCSWNARRFHNCKTDEEALEIQDTTETRKARIFILCFDGVCFLLTTIIHFTSLTWYFTILVKLVGEN